MATNTKRSKKLGDYEFACPKCKKVEKKSAYCIAQQTMGYTLIFTCTCRHKFEVPMR